MIRKNNWKNFFCSPKSFVKLINWLNLIQLWTSLPISGTKLPLLYYVICYKIIIVHICMHVFCQLIAHACRIVQCKLNKPFIHSFLWNAFHSGIHDICQCGFNLSGCRKSTKQTKGQGVESKRGKIFVFPLIGKKQRRAKRTRLIPDKHIQKIN